MTILVPRWLLPISIAGLLSWVSVVAPSSPLYAAVGALETPPDTLDTDRGALVEQLTDVQTALREQFPDSFGGLWIDDAGIPHVGSTGDVNQVRSLLVEYGLDTRVQLHSVAWSERHLDETIVRLSDAMRVPTSGDGFDILGIEANVMMTSLPENAVVIETTSGTADRIQLLLEQYPSVSVKTSGRDFHFVACSSRSNCGSPLKAGLTLFLSNGSTACQSAFVMKDVSMPSKYFLTSAGHCWNSSYTYRYHPSGIYIGNSANWYHPVSTPVDAMVFPIASSNASNQLYVTATTIRPVTQVEATSNEVIGESVCSSKLSGVSCGTLKSTNVCTEYLVCGQRLAGSQYACGGDSGSPVYVVIGSGPSARAMGILVAGTSGSHSCPGGQPPSGSDSLYTHITNAAAAFHMSVVTSAP